MTEIGASTRQLIDAMVAVERRRLEALCKRLGIEATGSELEMWALVGRTLAKEQPEFTGKQVGPGRPEIGLNSIDVRRAQLVELAQDVFREKTGRRLNIRVAIEFLNNTGRYSEFKATLEQSLQTLQNSVARGRTKLKRIRRL